MSEAVLLGVGLPPLHHHPAADVTTPLHHGDDIVVFPLRHDVVAKP